MKKVILSVIAVSTLSAALIGCGVRTTDPYVEGQAVVGDARVTPYHGRVVTDSDLVVYRRDPHHVFVYDGLRYRVKSYHNKYVYYRI